MNFSPIGDIAQSMMMRRQGNSLRQELAHLTQELASGQSRDLAKQVRGSFSTISAVEHSLKLQDGFAANRNLAEQILNFSQQSLGSMQSLIDDVGGPLLAVATGGTTVQIDPVIAQGENIFRDLVSFANTQASGRYVFAGAELSTKPINDADQILADLQAVTAGLSSSADFALAIDDWFENPIAGFQTTGYLGGDPASGKIDISGDQSIALDTTAKDQAFRDAFKHAATLALVAEDGFSGTESERQLLLQHTATGLIGASKGLVSLQAELGSFQQRLDGASEQAALEIQMLSSVKSEIVSVDPYEVATKLEAAQIQLESLYLITARTSRLNLSEYLR